MNHFRKVYTSLIIIALICSFNTVLKAQKIGANNPLPDKYKSKIGEIYFDKNVNVWEHKFLISSNTHNAAGTVGVVGVAFIKMAEKVLAQLDKDIAGSIPPEEDTVLLKETAYTAFNTVLNKNGTPVDNSDSDLKLDITIVDHGFHWATGAAIGVYVRVKARLSSGDGNTLWEQLYYMNRKEKKIPYNKKAFNVKLGVDGMLAEFKRNPALLKRTYEQICDMLAAKLLSK